MPCNSDYMEPTEQEIHRKAAARGLVYLRSLNGQSVSKELAAAANDNYLRNDAQIIALCKELRSMTQDERDALLYSDAKDRRRRHLAEWWEDHEMVDREREREEEKKRKIEITREKALKKLTKKEREALDL